MRLLRGYRHSVLKSIAVTFFRVIRGCSFFGCGSAAPGSSRLVPCPRITSHKELGAAELRSAATKDYAAASRRLGGSAPQPPPAFLRHGSDVPSVYATSPPPGLSRWSDDSALRPSDAASRRPRRAC